MSQSKTAIRYITRLSNRLRRNLDAFSSHDIYSGAEGRTLHFLIANSDIDVYQKDVEEEYGIRPSTATVLLKRMEMSGLITRSATDHDGRLKKIVVTEKGMQYRDKVLSQLQELEAQVMKDISPEDMDVFIRVCGQISSNLS